MVGDRGRCPSSGVGLGLGLLWGSRGCSDGISRFHSIDLLPRF